MKCGFTNLKHLFLVFVAAMENISWLIPTRKDGLMTQNQIAFAKLKEEQRHNYMTEVVDMGTLGEKARENSIVWWHYMTVDPPHAGADSAKAGLDTAKTKTEEDTRDPTVKKIKSEAYKNNMQGALFGAQRNTEAYKRAEFKAAAKKYNAEAKYYEEKPTLEREGMQTQKDVAHIQGVYGLAGTAVKALEDYTKEAAKHTQYGSMYGQIPMWN